MQAESHPTPRNTPREPRVGALTDNRVTTAEAADYAVDDCFFAVGQAVGLRKTVDYDAVIWWRRHFRRKFMTAIESFGNRWLEDREKVTGVAFMLAERAVRYADQQPSITLANAQQASADVQRYCELHARRARTADTQSTDNGIPRLAGYWCVDYKP